MTIRLYNTASKKKEEFIPLREGKAGIYVCGVTVYDHCHIGHARSFIVFDVLVKYFRARGLDVTYVRNFTDVDDKLIARANELGTESSVLAEKYIDSFHKDMDRLGVIKADIEPRATEHVDDMVEMIKRLIEKGYAYVVDEDVFFSVEKLDDYGKLSGRRLDDMKAGSRIEVNEKKRHPMDFALWKGAKPGEPRWESPWSQGRPGWHMECSVMSNRYLGSTFDIHGGGKDLLFPHHENERAQSKAANESEFARYWVHNGFLTVESEKMSKSLGNFITIRDALEEYPPEVLRLFLLSKHYRSPLDFSKKEVLNFQSGLIRIYRTLKRIEDLIGEYKGARDVIERGFLEGEQSNGLLRNFVEVMDDDLNSAGAIGLIFEKTKELNRLMDDIAEKPDESLIKEVEDGRDAMIKAATVLGLLRDRPDDFLAGVEKPVDIDEDEIERMVRERTEARENKDWARADAIRDKLQGMGIILEDKQGHTIWRRSF